MINKGKWLACNFSLACQSGRRTVIWVQVCGWENYLDCFHSLKKKNLTVTLVAATKNRGQPLYAEQERRDILKKPVLLQMMFLLLFSCHHLYINYKVNLLPGHHFILSCSTCAVDWKKVHQERYKQYRDFFQKQSLFTLTWLFFLKMNVHSVSVCSPTLEFNFVLREPWQGRVWVKICFEKCRKGELLCSTQWDKVDSRLQEELFSQMTTRNSYETNINKSRAFRAASETENSLHVLPQK